MIVSLNQRGEAEMPSRREINFSGLENDVQIEWPKRGRRKEPLPPALEKALHSSYETGSTASLSLPQEQRTTFFNLLARAGKELNYRVNKIIRDDEPEDGIVTFYFKVIGHRNDTA